MAQSRYPSRSNQLNTGIENLRLDLKPIAGKFVLSAINGDPRTEREICCFGARGDGKTFAALIAMIYHAKRHVDEGYDLPVPWMGVTDTFASHKIKTHRTLESAIWKGAWRLIDGGHKAICRIGGRDLVELDLFGIEDQGAMDRVRMETVGLWFEEPAPASVLVQSAGISDSSWLLAVTSQRIPSYRYPALITSNYPDEDHWTWQRFVINQEPGTCYYRIPPGERASAAQRREWETALASRPDMLQRLLAGQPGTVILGPQVAEGFSRDLFTWKKDYPLLANEPIILGFDFGHTPTCIIGQEWHGYIFVHYAICEQNAGVRQLITNYIKPWLAKNSPWALDKPDYLPIGYDPSGNTAEQADIDESPINVIRELLGGRTRAGPVNWDIRRNILLAAFGRMTRGIPAVQINPQCKDLVRSLEGRWYYPQDKLGNVSKDLPKKPNHPWEDYGDAFIYFLHRLGIGAKARVYPPQPPLSDPTIGY